MPEVIRHPAGGGTGGLDSGLRRNDVTGNGGVGRQDACTPSGRLRRQGAYTIAPDMAVSGHEDEPFSLGLGDQ